MQTTWIRYVLTPIKTFSNGKILSFWCENRKLDAILVSYDTQNFGFVLLYYWIHQNSLGKTDKILSRALHLIFSPTRLMNSTIHEHSCKIHYIIHYCNEKTDLYRVHEYIHRPLEVWHITRKLLFGSCDQISLKPAYSAESWKYWYSYTGAC